MVYPSKKVFLDLVGNGAIPPLCGEIPFYPPHEVYERLSARKCFLFESVKGPEKIARYSFIGFDPCLTVTVRDGIVLAESREHAFTSSERPLAFLKNATKRYVQKPLDILPPFQGGIAGLLSYDFVRYLEKLPVATIDDLKLPDAHFFFIDKLIAFDHSEKKCWIIACPGVRDIVCRVDDNSARPDWSALYDEAEHSVRETVLRISLPPRAATRSGTSPEFVNAGANDRILVRRDVSKEHYIAMVRRAKEYIAAGDIFQANLSQRVSADIGPRDPWDLYKVLRSINPSPFAAYVDFGHYQLVSSSPERLARIREGVIETRPIAGTRPRGKNSREDALMRRELLLNEKERAEHIMLIDLERNDIGKISSYGTVRVDELMITEDYSHVIHIVSNILGKLATGKDCFDAIRAVFPGGTITGVPKIRCMEIIDELEPFRRGPYTGSIGYIGFSGAMDLNIVIRTFVIVGGTAYIQVGAGIVADSDPEREYAETVNKAEALMKTLERV